MPPRHQPRAAARRAGDGLRHAALASGVSGGPKPHALDDSRVTLTATGVRNANDPPKAGRSGEVRLTLNQCLNLTTWGGRLGSGAGGPSGGSRPPRPKPRDPTASRFGRLSRWRVQDHRRRPRPRDRSGCITPQRSSCLASGTVPVRPYPGGGGGTCGHTRACRGGIGLPSSARSSRRSDTACP